MNDEQKSPARAGSYAEAADHIRGKFMANLLAPERDIVMDATQRLMESDAASEAKNVDDSAPDFNLPNAAGGFGILTNYLKQGPVVLSFYRGGWCPFCNLEFRMLHACLPQIRSTGATLVAISPELPAVTTATVEKNDLQFDVLSDTGNHVARRYGLIMQVDHELRPLYLKWGFDIPAANGDDSYELPVPATYVIDTGGIIRAAYINKDYTSRMEAVDIIKALKNL
jgi:peroxiredoxin